MSADVKELQQLVERERMAEETVRKAKEQAHVIVKTARENAASILQTSDSNQKLEELKQAKLREIAQKKADMDKEHRRKISSLEAIAQENSEKAITYVTEQTLRADN